MRSEISYLVRISYLEPKYLENGQNLVRILHFGQIFCYFSKWIRGRGTPIGFLCKFRLFFKYFGDFSAIVEKVRNFIWVSMAAMYRPFFPSPRGTKDKNSEY